MIMRMIFDIAIVDNDDEDNDNYCHPPDDNENDDSIVE